MKQRHITAYYISREIAYMANSKNVQNTFDSWKCHLLCNKMSKVEKYDKPRLKTVFKQHHFNVNRAQMNKYSCTQILISVHMDSFAYRSAQEKSSFFAFTPRTKILKRKLSRRKLREISRKFAQTTFFLREISRRNSAKTRGETPRTFAEFLREISCRYSAKTRSHFKKR